MELANRVGPIERLDWCERFREAVSAAIRHRHPDAAALLGVHPEDVAIEHVIDTAMRLEAWIAEQPELAASPDSETARRARAHSPGRDD